MAARAIILGLAFGAAVAAPRWVANLEPKNASKIAGTASVEAVGTDSTRATVQVWGATANSQLAWQIQSGSCGGKGQVFGNASAYPALTVAPDGKATGTVTLAGAAPVSGDYSVTVLKSKTDLTPAACGALKADTQAGYAPKDNTMTPKDSTMMPKDTTVKP
jgi:hypothetical protein